MGWQTQVAVQLQAGNTIINPNGIFTYSGTPAAGNLIFSSAPAAGTDQFGNAYVEGAAAYVTIAGTTYALEVGNQSGSGNAFLVHNLTSPPVADPLFSAIEASPAGCVAVIQSGQSAAGSNQAALEVADSTAAGVSGGEIDLLCGKTVLNNSGSPIPIAGISASIATLPNDTNSGSTWVAGERTFMNNNWVTNINGNFSTIIGALQNAGIIT
jgi:hypothetical protein